MESVEKEHLILGHTVMTHGVLEKTLSDPMFFYFMQRCLARHFSSDFGSIEPDSKQANNLAIQSKRGNVLSCYYQDNGERVWIMTDYAGKGENNRTTILFPDEY